MNIFISNIVLQLVLWELIRMWQGKENVEYVQHILDLQKLEVLTASVTKVIIEQSMKLYTMDAHVKLLLILSSEPNNFSSSTTEPPSKPSNLATVEIEQTSVVIEWDEPLILGGRKELWYRYQCSSCPPKTIAKPSENTFTQKRLELSGLRPGMTYTVMVFAENQISKIAPEISQYALIEFTTRPIAPMLVKDLRIEGVQDGGVTIAWKSPIEGESIVQQLRQPMYEVQYYYRTHPKIQLLTMLKRLECGKFTVFSNLQIAKDPEITDFSSISSDSDSISVFQSVS
ncbi:unnamed protein product [Dracunculus medinensis]|uniref:Fibronectin type-III domain-containing protein n=1 Tax=Dracunculus medinensis TaxID=318479 RepID=A0A0N4US85_DRAME|nr:unnamed protein product [Dracunculus medinensis]